MKKNYVYGYSNEKLNVKEKYVAVFLVGMCIAAGLITFFVVGISKNINKKSDILIESRSKDSVEVINEHMENGIEKPLSEEAMSESAIVNKDAISYNKATNTDGSKPENKETPEEEKANDMAEDNSYIFPCPGEIIYEFSPKIPIYSPTLKDWRTHNGIDIKASLGEEVIAVNHGIVESVFEDLRYGNTVVILHSDNIKSVYSNLKDTISVNNGDKIEKGSVIAHVGDTALFETIADTHLHFELIVNGSYVNPEDYLKFK